MLNLQYNFLKFDKQIKYMVNYYVVNKVQLLREVNEKRAVIGFKKKRKQTKSIGYNAIQAILTNNYLK